MTPVPPLSRVKLLQFVALLGIGGTERQVVNLVRTLDSSKFELHFGCLVRVGEFVKELEALGPLAEYKISRLYNLGAAREALRLAGYIRRHRIQIVHTYGFYANVFALPAARLAGIPVAVASIRDNGDLWTPMQRRVQRLVCRLADCILTNADSVRHSVIAEGYDPTPVEVIRNGIDLAWVARQVGRSQLRRNLGLTPRVPLVALVSRLNRLKGVECFLEAAAMVAGRFPEARFLIVGDTTHVANGALVQDSAYSKELESYAIRLGLGRRVIFAGRRADVPGLLSEVSVSVLSSLSEGLSNVLLESMAAGVPVIATRVGGNPEVVEDGVTGLLVPPADPHALAEAISRVLADEGLASRLAEAGRQHVATHFSLERMTRETERLYLRLLGEARFASVAARFGLKRIAHP